MALEDGKAPASDGAAGHPLSTATDAQDPKKASRTNSTTPEKPTFNFKKANKILDACRYRDVAQLKELALSEGGFLSDGLREEACEQPPFLLHSRPIQL